MNSPIVRNIVGRCHVGESYRWVIRYVISHLARGYKTYRAMPKESRRELLQQIVKEHHQNRKLYNRVMRGGVY